MARSEIDPGQPSAEQLEERRQYGTPSAGSANPSGLQHLVHHHSGTRSSGARISRHLAVA